MDKEDLDLVIRDASVLELQELLTVQKIAFKRYSNWLSLCQIPALNETLSELREDFHSKHVIAAEVNGKPAGSIKYAINEGVCVLERMSVVPKLHRNGIGRALVNEVEKRVNGNTHKISLETRMLGSNILIFFTKLGFLEERVLKKHSGGFDWLTFSKFI